MQNKLLISAIIIIVALSTIYLFVNFKKRQKVQTRAKDYETLLDGLKKQIESQKALVESLTDAVEFSNTNKNSGLDSLVSEVGNTARDQLDIENSKLKAQLAFFLEVEEKRDSELKNLGA